MRTLIWNISNVTQTLPAAYGSVSVPAGRGFVTEDSVEFTVPNLGGLAAIDGIFLVYPISADEPSGIVDPTTFSSFFFDRALMNNFGGGGGGVSSWNDLLDKPSFATVALSGSYNDLTNKPSIPAPTALSDVAPPDLGVATAGTSADASRSNHTHAHGDQGGGTQHSAATVASAGFMSASDKSKLNGIAANAAALTSLAPASVGTSNAVGSSSDAAKADHVHAHGVQSDATLHALASGSAHGFMSSNDFIKLASVAGGAVTVGNTTPADVAATAASGSAGVAARADHAHAHGNLAGGSLHAAATQSAAGFMSAADKTKLDGLSTIKAYDLMGYYNGATPVVGLVLTKSLVPRAITISNFITGPVGCVPVKLQVNGADVTLTGADVAVNANDVLSVVVTNASGSEVYFTVKGKEA